MTMRKKEPPNHMDTSEAFVPDPADDRETTGRKLNQYLTAARLKNTEAMLETRDSYHYSEPVRPNHTDPSRDFVADPMDDKKTSDEKRKIWAQKKYEHMKRTPVIAIADPDDISDAFKRACSFDNEGRDRMHSLLRRVFGRDLERVERYLVPVNNPGFLSVLNDEFPLFSEVTNSVIEQLSLFWRLQEATEEAQSFRLRPMLLVGGPGMGKSAYSRCLAELLSVPFSEIQMASATAGFVLSGTTPMWSNAKAGMVFDSVVAGRTANPIILLDELDKMNDDPRYRPEGALYSLLERDSAAIFTDEYVGFPIDASYISWVATANDTKAIPAPILSRLDVFEVPVPTIDVARRTALSVYKKVLRTEPWGVLFEGEPGEDVIDLMASMSPREASLAIGRAFGKACVAGRGYVTPEDMAKVEVKRLKAGFI